MLYFSGHKDTVYCVCYAKDGKKFASGSADKSVIVWTSKLDGILKYSHSEAVQCMQFNPITHQLVSCSSSELTIWSSEQKNLQKVKSGGRINCCSWTRNGQYLAIGFASGYVSIRNKNGDEHLRIDRPGTSAVWSLSWGQPRDESNNDILAIAEWNGTISFYTQTGRQIGRERTIDFIPLKILHFPDGQYLLVVGSNKKCLLMTNEGFQLTKIGNDYDSWVWSCAVNPTSSHIAIGTQNGNINYLQLSWDIVHGLYGERYAYRENMTDIIIQNLQTSQKVRIKCKDLIKKIAVYRDKLAVQLPERVIIYELSGNDGMHYRCQEKLGQSLDCNLLVVTSKHLVLCLDKRLQSLSFTGVVEREWILDNSITYIKVIGGPVGKECIITGLKSGQVVKIYLDNPFPSIIMQLNSSIRCLDISSQKEKLAIVTDNGSLTIININSSSSSSINNDDIIYEKNDVTSVSFNRSFEDMYCFSTNDTLSIKVSNFPEYHQKFSGFVVGNNGSKVYCIIGTNIKTIDIPLTTTMYQYIDINDYISAYKIACLGVAETDWLSLGLSSLEKLELKIAENSFTRLKNLRYIEVVNEILEKLETGEWGREGCMAIASASMGKLRDAAKLYQKAGLQQYALDMYSDLRMFDIAQEFITSGNSQDRTVLLRRRAEWAKSLGEPRAAAEMFLAAGDIQRAINIISEYGWIDLLIKVGRQIDKGDRNNLTIIGKKLRKLGATHGAAEIFTRLGDDKDVADVLIDAQAWPEAFELAERNTKLKSHIYGPYARWLVDTGRFSEAQEAFKLAGQVDESIHVLTTLADNAIIERRFKDASYFYWLLSQLSLELKDKNDNDIINIFNDYSDKADIYYAYHEIFRYQEEPFTSFMPEALFNISRYLLNKIQGINIYGISKVQIIYALIKQAKTLGANKLSMQLLEKLKTMKIPDYQQSQIEILTLSIKSYQYTDPEELLPLCYRCSTFNSLLPSNNKHCNCCVQCGLKFQYSFGQFEILPLVEFQLEDDIDDDEAEKLIYENIDNIHGDDDNDDDNNIENQLTIDDNITDLFTAKMIKFNDPKIGDSIVKVGRKVLKNIEPTSVIIIKWPLPFRTKYYKNLLPDLQITFCKYCLRLFHADDYELALLRQGHCPFCRVSTVSIN